MCLEIVYDLIEAITDLFRYPRINEQVDDTPIETQPRCIIIILFIASQAVYSHVLSIGKSEARLLAVEESLLGG